MCLFKRRDFKEANILNSLVGAGIFAIILAIVLPFITAPDENLASKFALAQLALSSVGFILIIVTLCFTIVQLRKSTAKPKLRVAFQRDGATEVGIHIRRDKSDDYNLYLWIFNDGNAVTRLFQIDFEIPDIFEPKLKPQMGGRFLPYETIRPTSNGDASKDTRIISFYNDWDFCVFVNNPIEFLTLSLKSFPQNYKEYKKEYEIHYRVFGDWAETQEGKLKITCNKK